MSVFFNRFLFVIIGFFTIGWLAVARSQDVNTSTSVDFYHPGSASVNPAIINFQDEQLIVGTHALHSGFLKNNAFGLRHDMFQISVPEVRGLNIGFGLQGDYLKTPIFTQSRLGITASFRVFDSFAWGVNIGFINESFDRSKFQLIDENDPVFSSGNSVFVPNLGVGFIYQHSDQWRYGLSFDQLNQPDVSLSNSGENLPLITNGAVLYKHRLFESTLGFRMTGQQFEPVLEIASGYQGVGLLRTGFHGGRYLVGGQLYISNKMSVDYQFAYALTELNQFSSGSHRVSFVYRFGKIPQIEYAVNAVYDSLRISERRVQHFFENVLSEADSTEPKELIEQARFDTRPDEAYYRFVVLDSVPPIPEIDFNAYLVNYGGLIKNLTTHLNEDNLLTLRVIVRQKKKRVASAFVHHLNAVYGIAKNRLEYGYAEKYVRAETNGHASSAFSLSQNNNKFVIEPRIKRKYNRIVALSDWQLNIMASDGTVLKEFRGQYDLPEYIHWDWKSNSGKLLDAGNYFYYLEWRGKRGNLHRSPYQKLHVSKFKREVNIKVNRVEPVMNSASHRIDLVLGL
ncbi:MAG: type IX secretion system membrane protein PorP/SprF [Calditrichaeota bacterium]|nr:MAG: type IX secretion system membrane protein PorP/SprF [Calditrichota bacterium]